MLLASPPRPFASPKPEKRKTDPARRRLGKEEAWEERKGPDCFSRPVLSCHVFSHLRPPAPTSQRRNRSEEHPLKGRLLRLQKPDGQASPSGRQADVGLCSRNAAFPGPAAEECRLDGETVRGGRGVCKRRKTVPEIISGAIPDKLPPRRNPGPAGRSPPVEGRC